MGRLGEQEIDQRLRGSDWHRDGDAIVNERRCEDFAAAIALTNRVAELAEAANHHPDILIHGYRNLRLTLSTHSEGGVTDADIEMARRIDAL